MALPLFRPIVIKKLEKAFDSPDWFFDNPDWIFEPMYDGFRAMLIIDGPRAHFINRKIQNKTRFRELARRIRDELNVESAVIDGEIIVAHPESGYSDITRLKKGDGQAVHAAFDLVYLDGKNLASRPLHERKKILRKLTSKKKLIFSVRYLNQNGRDMMATVGNLNWKGLIAKRKNDIYTPLTCWYRILNPNYKKPPKKA